MVPVENEVPHNLSENLLKILDMSSIDFWDSTVSYPVLQRWTKTDPVFVCAALLDLRKNVNELQNKRTAKTQALTSVCVCVCSLPQQTYQVLQNTVSVKKEYLLEFLLDIPVRQYLTLAPTE